MSTASTKYALLQNFKDPEYREAFISENVYTGLCAQTRVLREQRSWSQKKLGRKAGMAQERISILEDPNAETKPTLGTILRLASAFNVGLDVRFVPFGTVLNRSVNTNDSDLEVPEFDKEVGDLQKQIEDEIAAEKMAEAMKREKMLGTATKVLKTYYDKVMFLDLDVLSFSTGRLTGLESNMESLPDDEAELWRGFSPLEGRHVDSTETAFSGKSS